MQKTYSLNQIFQLPHQFLSRDIHRMMTEIFLEFFV